MIDPTVIVVYLRQPDTSNPNESRDDPFWEFGSFGCTGCHSHNLMHLGRLEELKGCRLAFVQGGAGEIRLVYVSPPVAVRFHRNYGEAIWQPAEMPLTFNSAPVLVGNDVVSEVPSLVESVSNVNRTSLCGQFASKFRSRRTPLPVYIGKELVRVYEKYRKHGSRIAKCYAEAMPYPPPKVDKNRRATYDRHLKECNDSRTLKRASYSLSFSSTPKQRTSRSRC